MNEITQTPTLIQLYGSLDAVQREKPSAFFSLFEELVANNSDCAPALTEWTIKRVKDSKIKNILLLDWAINHNCPKLIRRLVKNGSQEQANNEINAAALCFSAALLGQTSTLDLLKKNGVDVSDLQDDSKQTILHLLVLSEKFTGSAAELTWLRKLIEQNPTLLTQLDSCGRTPLDCAILTKKNALVNLFIELKPAKEPFSQDGLFPLLAAIITAQSSIVDLLIEHGANLCARDTRGGNLLHLLVDNDFPESEQQIKWLRELINTYPHLLNQQGAHGWTPLHVAASKGNNFLVSLFLEFGADKEALTGDSRTPLIIAAANSKLSTIKLLIDQGANPNAQSNRRLGWMHYLKDISPEDTQQMELARKLVENHPQLQNQQDAIGWTPLHYAAGMGNDFLVSLFLEFGADKDAKTGDDKTPLMVAASTSKLSTLELLIELGANPNSQDRNGRGWMHYLKDISPEDTQQMELARKLVQNHAQLQNQQDAKGWTPLHYAAGRGENFLVSLFLEFGAEKEALAVDGSTPLMVAGSNSKLSTLELLIELGANPNSPDKNGLGWMHSLKDISPENTQQMELARTLVESHPQLLNQQTAQGWTPLHYAVSAGNDFLVSLFLEFGADKDAQTVDGRTPLIIAAVNSKLSTLKLLIDQGANPNVQDQDGRGWMQYLQDISPEDTQQMELARTLVQNHAQLLKLQGTDGWTPLHYAAGRGENFLVSLFLEFGADKDALTGNGSTPLIIAAVGNKLSTIELLIKQGANLDLRNESGIGWMHHLVSKHFCENESEVEWLKKIVSDVPSVLNLGKKDQFTLMQYAAKQGNTKFVEHLQSFGISIDNLSALFINKLEGQVLSQEDNQEKIDIGQNRLNEKIKNYLLYKMSEDELKLHSPYDEGGLCEGYALLFGYYSSRGKMDEFFHSLEQISLWDGTEASLNTPPIYPEIALLYPTLRDFFEQWTNDILLFQAGSKYFESQHLGQANFIEKYEIVKKDSDFEPLVTGKYRLYTDESFKKLLAKSKSKTTFFSLTNRTKDGAHGTGIFVSQKGLMTFYDPNRSQRIKSCRFIEPFAEALKDYFIKAYQTDRISKKLEAHCYEFIQPSTNDASCTIS